MTGQEKRVVVVVCFLFLLGSAAHWYRKSGLVGEVAVDGPPATEVSEPGGGKPDAPIDVNRCTAADLVALPGIGAVKADAIIGWRESHGPFVIVDDLDSVPGIGPATVERLRPRVTTGGAARAAPTAEKVEEGER